MAIEKPSFYQVYTSAHSSLVRPKYSGFDHRLPHGVLIRIRSLGAAVPHVVLVTLDSRVEADDLTSACLETNDDYKVSCIYLSFSLFTIKQHTHTS